VLAGGAARGAYEVGVVRYIEAEIARALGRDIELPILCGTSVGAINICGLAAFADEPRSRAIRLEHHWENLRIGDILKLDRGEIFTTIRSVLGMSIGPEAARRGGVVDPAGLIALLTAAIPFPRIAEHLKSGRLRALSVSATQVSTGRTIVFVQRDSPGLPPWSSDATIIPHAVEISIEHALASAALPLIFPAVKIAGEYYVDGGLRQNVPLSPARRLGADGLVVVNPRHIPGREPPAEIERGREAALPSPVFLLGKALNALMLDRIDNDIDRLNRINDILDAGCRRFGPGFIDELNREMGHPAGRGVKPLRAVLIRASRDIGQLCAEYVRSKTFERRVGGVLLRVLRRLAEGESQREADLLSYLLFDGEFAKILIALGRDDAKARHDELCEFFERMQGG
jgi:NTE family protein